MRCRVSTWLRLPECVLVLSPSFLLFNAFFALLFFGFVRRHAKVLVRLLSVLLLLLLPLLYFPNVFVPDDALNT